MRAADEQPAQDHRPQGYGLKIVEHVPFEIAHPSTRDYLRTKRDKLGHRLHHQHLKLDETPKPAEPPAP